MAFLKIGFILEYFQAHRKTELNVQSFHKTPYHFPCTTYPIIHRPHHSRVQRRVDEPTLTNHHIALSPQFMLQCILGFPHSMALKKCVMICIHQSAIGSVFTILKILYVPLFNSYLFNCLHSFAFPECHIVGIMPYVASSDCLLSLSNMHLNFLRVFSWLDS